ncbi:MAG: dephospho-CoA kinase [Spirochaetaceae bacterium 4572_59]|nr:MAG: dephospho-CoA kinase [Spirochaetaceae bacterium 4572_59]
MVLGLAGKSCAGKNVLADLLVKRGWESIDMDLLSHQVLEEKSFEAAALFGHGVLGAEGRVDRQKLASLVFSDPLKLKQLENLIYPELHGLLNNKIASRDENPLPLLINAAALQKSEFWKICDAIIWVEAPLPVRFIRACRRDRKSPMALIRRFHAQRKLNPQYFFQRVDIYTIKNGGSRKRLEKHIDRWLQALPSE